MKADKKRYKLIVLWKGTNTAKDMSVNTVCLMHRGIGYHILSRGSCII
jgi:hypothetical protein